jgi:hypothetical protein
MAPPPHTPTFADIPTEVGTLFRRAFERGSAAGTRPLPAEWLSALKRLEQSIVECAADAGHKYWRGAHSCVWCRLAEHGGPEYYFGVAGSVGTFDVNEAKLQEVIRRLENAKPADFPFNRTAFSSSDPTAPVPVPSLINLKTRIEQLREKVAKQVQDEREGMEAQEQVWRRREQQNRAEINKQRLSATLGDSLG